MENKNEWKKVKLGEIVTITMGQSPKSEFYNLAGEGVPFLQGNRTFGEKFPSFDTYTTKVTKIAKKNDVIMSVRAPIGDLNLATTDICLGRGVCSLRMNNGNYEFLFYLLKYYSKQLINNGNGTVFTSINRNEIYNLEINIPNNEFIQKKISKILSDIDNKIELNNKINNNLEKQVQLIFNNHFFNKDKNYTNYISSNLLEIADFLNGLAMQKYTPNDFNEKSYPVLKIKELNQGFTDKNSDRCSNKIKPEYIINNGDIIFSWSGTLLIKIWCGNKC
uniref:restriction endonuclease subunit S n=1 Tax=uncultured Fusobacterium sp. TaxID=159267 RepID=UPI0015A5557A